MSHFLKDVKADDIVLDALPDGVLGSMETRDRWMASLRYTEGALEFLVADLQAWTPGQTIRVAFLGGSTDLHQAIENATREISEAGNLTLDFKQNGVYQILDAQRYRVCRRDSRQLRRRRLLFSCGHRQHQPEYRASSADGWRTSQPTEPQPGWIRRRAAGHLAGDSASRVPARVVLSPRASEHARSL